MIIYLPMAYVPAYMQAEAQLLVALDLQLARTGRRKIAGVSLKRLYRLSCRVYFLSFQLSCRVYFLSVIVDSLDVLHASSTR